MNLKWDVLASLMAFICVSCSPSALGNIVTDEPPRSVEIVSSIEGRPTFVADLPPIQQGPMCIQINQGEIWEPGNEAPELNQHIQAHVELMLDGESVSPTEPIFSWATITMKYADDGAFLGSYGGEMDICIDIQGLALGSHTATITVPSISGVKHSFSWEFRIFETSTIESES